MKFQVPQFIQAETKLIGPLTLRQFLWVAGGVCMIVMEFLLLGGVIRIIAVLLTGGFFGALAFLKMDGMPFINFLAYMLSYALGSKRYVYKPAQGQDLVLPPSQNGTTNG
jgi:hypothetical protein